ncbi:hypothetical protein Anas_07720 [Armadillidium nasatum]|uniref:Uncharacterized protein n=1 Tax=Armadillidium nasatum TaxID=96803 RepID=A0A5N5SSH1_9CRUS|nr:hypothetical protein Anas_07720 [Armadillidium nasatum]
MSTSRGGGRRVFYQIFKDFIDSFSTRKNELKGNFVGEDLFGNKFFENPGDPSRGKRLSRRSFEPAQKMHFDVDNIHRRKEPPTIEELKANMAIAEAKKINARKLAEKDGKLIEEKPDYKGMTSFPIYEEYETNPGKGDSKFKK